jgi:hypothetical protein
MRTKRQKSQTKSSNVGQHVASVSGQRQAIGEVSADKLGKSTEDGKTQSNTQSSLLGSGTGTKVMTVNVGHNGSAASHAGRLDSSELTLSKLGGLDIVARPILDSIHGLIR